MTIRESLAQISDRAAERAGAEWNLKSAVRRAHADEIDISKIARAAGVSRTTIYQWLKEEK